MKCNVIQSWDGPEFAYPDHPGLD